MINVLRLNVLYNIYYMFCIQCSNITDFNRYLKIEILFRKYMESVTDLNVYFIVKSCLFFPIPR